MGGPVVEDRVRKTTDMVVCPVVGGRLHLIAVPAPKIIFVMIQWITSDAAT